MRVFITGATGYIGNAVALDLHRRGHDVVGLARSDSAKEKLLRQGISHHLTCCEKWSPMPTPS
jgi:nucleoside-diphosphate-sugar epimerase